MKKFLHAAAVSISLIGAAACTSTATAQDGRGIPIVVMAEDSDKNSVRRSSDIFRRVTTELQEQLRRYDYYVIDEEFIAGKLGWEVRDRRPKTELVQVVDLAMKTGDATFSPRAMVIVKIRASAKDMGFATAAQVRITGDIYDIDSNAYIGGWEAPTREFPAQKKCNAVCINEVVGDNARELATTLGDVLRKKLAALTRGDGGRRIAEPGANNQLVNRYLVIFKNFSLSEILNLTDAMETEFDGFVQARAPQGDSALLRYNYESYLKSNKLFRDINRLLLLAGYPEEQFKVLVKDRREFLIDKLYEGAPRASGPVLRGN